MGGNIYTDIYLLINIIISAQDPILSTLMQGKVLKYLIYMYIYLIKYFLYIIVLFTYVYTYVIYSRYIIIKKGI